MRHSLRAVSLWWLIVLVPIMAGAAAPRAKNDFKTTVAGRSVPIKVTANDRGSIDHKTVELVGRDPLGGTARVKRRNGKVIYTPRSDFSGQDTFKYRFKDNRGAWSNKARVTVTVEVAVAITSLQEDSGTNKSDFITNDNTPTLSGTAATGITEVTLYQDGTPVPPAVPVNNDGTWSYTYPPPGLDDDDYTFTATGKNAESSPSAAKTVTVDTTEPSEPGVSQNSGCFVSANALINVSMGSPVLVPELPSPGVELDSCLTLGSSDGGIPDGVELHRVKDESGIPTKVDEEDEEEGESNPYSYPVKGGFSDGVLRIEITDPLLSGDYHLKFFVSDVAGNESCVESFVIPEENTLCAKPDEPVFFSVTE